MCLLSGLDSVGEGHACHAMLQVICTKQKLKAFAFGPQKKGSMSTVAMALANNTVEVRSTSLQLGRQPCGVHGSAHA
jgi:hypothetical protein